MTLGESSIKLVNIYAPNNDSALFFQFLKEKVLASSHDHCILCGDLNLVLNPALDCLNYVNVNNPQAKRCVTELISSLSLEKVQRDMQS